VSTRPPDTDLEIPTDPQQTAGRPPRPDQSPIRTAPSARRYGGARPAGPVERGRRALAWLDRIRFRLLGVDDLPDDDRPAGRARLLAGAVAVFYVVYQLLTRGQMVLGGAMYAEMATRYYDATTTLPWYDQLVATDAGYVPLPQRLIALVGHTLGVPATAIPYFYTGVALVLTGLLIGSICLPAFRRVIGSDLLRLALALGLVLVPDYETRSFINFTYLVVIVIGFLSALALVSPEQDVPGWAWLVPVLVISKPAVLTALPMMAVAAVFARRRFRLVTVVSLIAGILQLVRLGVSAQAQTSLLQDSTATLADKLAATLKYTVGLLGRGATGPTHQLTPSTWMWTGVLVAVVALAAVAFLRSRAGSLVLVGLALVLFAMLLDSFTFSVFFTPEMPMLGVPAFDRRFIVAEVGVLFVVAGVIASVVDSPVVRRWLSRLPAHLPAPRRWLPVLGAVVFALWFSGSGWLLYSAQANRDPGLPSTGVSQWEDRADLLAPDLPVVCIPIDPFGWSYGRHCTPLAGDPIDPATVRFVDLPELETAAPAPWYLDVPEEVVDARLAAFTVLARPASGDVVRATATLTTSEGDSMTLTSESHLPSRGGAVTFTVPRGETMDDVANVSVQFDTPVQVISSTGDTSGALVLWMGRPAS
jgi:hypothetical protein